MGDWRFGDSSRYGQDDQTAYATTVTAGSPAHTKGAWVQFVASLPFDIDGFFLLIRFQPGQNYLFDIGIGGAGSEVVLVPNAHLGPTINAAGSDFMCGPIYVPLRLRAGTRVALRSQCALASRTFIAKMQFVGATFGKPGGYHRSETVGALTGTSAGTAATTGGVNTKGSWAQLTASAPISAKHVLFFAVAPTGTATDFTLDLGIGGAGSEVVVVPDLFYTTAAMNGGYMGVWSFPLIIRAGERIAYRGKSGVASLPLTADLVLFD